MPILHLQHFHPELLIILSIFSILEFSQWKSLDSEECLKITPSTRILHCYLLTIVFAVKTAIVQFDN